MKLQALLSELGSHMGLANVKLDDAGVCRLNFDDSIAVDLEQHSQEQSTLLMHSVVGQIPPENKLPFYLKLLQANYLTRSTEGSVLSLDPVSLEVVLWREVNAETTEVDVLADLLVAFVRSTRDWTERLGGWSHSGEAASDERQFASMIRV